MSPFLFLLFVVVVDFFVDVTVKYQSTIPIDSRSVDGRMTDTVLERSKARATHASKSKANREIEKK
jgi:hypothetical protein